MKALYNAVTGLAILLFSAATTNAQVTPETALGFPEVETIIGLQMPGGQNLMDGVDVISNGESDTAIELDAIDTAIDNEIDDDAVLHGGDDVIITEEEVDKEELIIRLGNPIADYAKLTMYPNPANQFINLRVDIEGSYEVQIYNLIGSSIYFKNTDLYNNELRIDLSDLHPGMYMMHVTAPDNSYMVKKFAVKRN